MGLRGRVPFESMAIDSELSQMGGNDIEFKEVHTTQHVDKVTVETGKHDHTGWGKGHQYNKCDPCMDPCADPCADPCDEGHGGGWGILGLFVLFFLILFFVWILIFWLRPGFCVKDEDDELDNGRAALCAFVAAFIIVIFVWIIVAFFSRKN